MEKIVIKTNRLRYFVLLIVAIGFSVTGLLMIIKSHEIKTTITGWSCLLLFGGCVPLFVWQIIDSSPRLIIDDKGIYARSLKIGIIPWDEIEGAYIKSLGRQAFICLQLKDYEKYLPKSSSLTNAIAATNKALGLSPISLSFSGIDADINQVCELIIKKSAQARSK